MAEVLPRLKRHARVVIASNSDTAPLNANVARAGLDLDAVVSSEELRAYKPHPRFYERLLERLGTTPDQIVFVGDTLDGDVLAPRRAGIESIWLRRPGVVTGADARSDEPSASSLAEVEQLLIARNWMNRTPD